jgi:hypothetical protein
MLDNRFATRFAARSAILPVESTPHQNGQNTFQSQKESFVSQNVRYI